MTVLADLWAMLKDSREWKSMAEAAAKVPQLEARIAALEAAKVPGATGVACDHCGSGNLLRVGSRPDPQFKELGIKQASYQCRDCNGLTYETIVPK